MDTLNKLLNASDSDLLGMGTFPAHDHVRALCPHTGAAIANVLLLRNQLTLPPGVGEVSEVSALYK